VNQEPEVSARSLADQLRGQIHRGELGPGDRLMSERDFAAEYGTTRPVVREALGSLEKLGYLATRRGATGGRFVTSLRDPFQAWARMGKAQLDDIVDFRLAVECQAVRFAAERRTKADVAAIAKAAKQLERARTPGEYRLADVAFHSSLATAAKSERLAAAVEQARGDLFEPTDDLWEQGLELTVAQHSQILRAIADGQPNEAAAAMYAHIEATRAEMHTLTSTL
jgi:GntR family transcriptional regulator, transcriptional repressor for pyruvate dehydrogenase complex